MDIFSLSYACFLAVALIAYYAMGHIAPRLQWTVLLASSIAFYGMVGGWSTLGFMVATALTTWLGSQGLKRLSDKAKQARKLAPDRKSKKAIKEKFAKRRRLVLIASFAVCLGILGYLKYWNTILFNLHLEPSTHSLGILLPLGISFYMFASLGYIMEVYNEKYDPEQNFARFFLFVSWFPQIIQGPINRYGEISQQMFAPRHASWNGMRRATLRLAYGLFKKYAIANALIGNYSAIMENANGSTMSPVIIIGILLYSVQMYADFSGGIDMVEGVSELFGIEMAQNFRQPYFSTSLADFWRRWHMSLGVWMKSYVFYPLAVSKPLRSLGKKATNVLGKQVGRTISACVANVIVFCVVGLWHGAELHYLAWGLYNGVIIALADLCAPLFDRLAQRTHVNRASAWFRVFSIVRTFVVVAVGRYFDCITDVAVSFACLKATFTNIAFRGIREQLSSMGVGATQTFGFEPIAIIACVVVFVISVLYERGCDVRTLLMNTRLPIRVAIYIACGIIFVLSLRFSLAEGEAFLYANF